VVCATLHTGHDNVDSPVTRKISAYSFDTFGFEQWKWRIHLIWIVHAVMRVYHILVNNDNVG
jgi:hypothetical protein